MGKLAGAVEQVLDGSSHRTVPGTYGALKMDLVAVVAVVAPALCDLREAMQSFGVSLPSYTEGR